MWTEAELQATFSDILKVTSPSTKTLCIVDALDECEEKSLRQARDFALTLAASVASSNLRFRVLCSNSPENAIELKFSRYSIFKIQKYTAEDIKKFANVRLEEVAHSLQPDNGAIGVSRELINKIVSKAEGVFIWAKLVVVELILAIEDGGDDAELNRKLEQLPSELEELFTRILWKIPLESRHQTFNFLQILVGFEPLDFSHPSNLIGMALAIHPAQEALTSPALTMVKE